MRTAEQERADVVALMRRKAREDGDEDFARTTEVWADVIEEGGHVGEVERPKEVDVTGRKPREPETWDVKSDTGFVVDSFTTDEWNAFEARAREVLLRAWKHGACPVKEAEGFALFPLDGRGRGVFEMLGVLLGAMEEQADALDAAKGRAA